MALTVGVAALLSSGAWDPQGMAGAYLAAGVSLLFGVVLILGRPAVLVRERLVPVLLDSALVGVLVAYTGGTDSPFFPLYLLAALGIAWIETRPRVAVATAVLVAGYPVAVLASGGAADILSSPVALKAGFIALFCVVVTFLASEVQGFRKLAVGLSSTLAKEIDRVESDERLISEFGPVLKVMSLEGVLGWTVEAAHALGGGPYAHVAALKGNHHRTLMDGDSDACPSWWHPAIQRLVLQSSRGGNTVRSDEEIHGIEGFVAVPLGTDDDEKWGAIVVGGGEYGAEEERALRLLAAGAGSALEEAGDAPGGLDQLTGLPNRASLRRVLRRELSSGRPLTILAMHLSGLRDYAREHGSAAGGALLRRVGQKLGDGWQRAFLYGDEEFVVVLGGSGDGRARRAALVLQQHAAEETGALPPAAVGWVFAETGDEVSVLNAALRAMERAKGRPEGLSGPADGVQEYEASEDESRVVGIARTLVEAMEA